MNTFKEYAKFYDALYQDKNYHVEADYIDSLIKNYAPTARKVLDVGCGTGNHSIALAQQGYDVSGIDLSYDMVEFARKKMIAKSKESISFDVGDVRRLSSEVKYDVILLLFHVFDYITDPFDVNCVVKAIHGALAPGGICILDFWHTPAVKESSRELGFKEAQSDSYKIFRISKTSFDFQLSLAKVKFLLFAESLSSNDISKIEEQHTLRFYTQMEVVALFKDLFEVVTLREWLSTDSPTEKTFSVCLVLRKK